jgi:hypothetical protein
MRPYVKELYSSLALEPIDWSGVEVFEGPAVAGLYFLIQAED